MVRQLNILEAIAEGERLRDEGLARAVDHADRENDKWSERCYRLFKWWLSSKPSAYEFMMEDFISHVKGSSIVEMPPVNQAFGFISKRGVKDNLIEFSALSRTKNPVSHRRPANVWRKL